MTVSKSGTEMTDAMKTALAEARSANINPVQAVPRDPTAAEAEVLLIPKGALLQSNAAAAFRRIDGVKLREETGPNGRVLIVTFPPNIANALKPMSDDELDKAFGGPSTPFTMTDENGVGHVTSTEANKSLASWNQAVEALAKAVPGTKLSPAPGQPAGRPGPTR